MLNIEKSEKLLDKIMEIIGIKSYNLIGMLDNFDKYPRAYHSSDHILDLCEKILRNNHMDVKITKALLITALYHDYIYDPKSKTNEEDSAKKFLEDSKQFDLYEWYITLIYRTILETKNHIPSSNFSRTFCEYDLSSFDDTFDKVLEGEYNIRKEYTWVDWDIYKIEKLKFLNKYIENDIIKNNIRSEINVKYLIKYIENEKAPNIAIYPGSFNPFHKGHLNILEKAEAIFDKVIIAYGNNPDKELTEREIPECLKYRQVDFYEGSLVEYINSKSYNPVIIRGLRNSTDLQYELDQYRWLQEFKKDVKLVSIFCDAKYQHISSSNIRGLSKFEDLEEESKRFKL